MTREELAAHWDGILLATHRLWRLDTLQQGGTQFITQAMSLAILLYEAWLVLEGRLSLGQLVATLAPSSTM